MCGLLADELTVMDETFDEDQMTRLRSFTLEIVHVRNLSSSDRHQRKAVGTHQKLSEKSGPYTLIKYSSDHHQALVYRGSITFNVKNSHCNYRQPTIILALIYADNFSTCYNKKKKKKKKTVSKG